MQEGHIFSGRDADVALGNEATLAHILSLYSEATLCYFRDGDCNHDSSKYITSGVCFEEQRNWLEKYCNTDYITPYFCLPYKQSRDTRNVFLRFLCVPLQNNF